LEDAYTISLVAAAAFCCVVFVNTEFIRLVLPKMRGEQ
jgi:hypothetical protein